MTPAELVVLLDTVPAHQLEAVRLIGELYAMGRDGILDSAALILLQADIAAALQETEAYLDQVKGVTRRCCALPPVPAASPPPGF